MIRKKFQNLEWLEFEQLQDIPHLTHAIFLRRGGNSQGPFASFNLGLGIGDDNRLVQQHFKEIKSLFQIKKMHFTRQVHQDEITVVTTKSPEELPSCDALITKQTDTALLMRMADCQVALFYDPIKKVIANVHCGWRGSVSNIYHKTIRRLKKEFLCKEENILVSISPSLGPHSSEFIHYKKELPSSFLKKEIKPNHFDFWQISYSQLIEASILPHHIEIAGINTCGSEQDFFSFRRDRICGRNGTLITLKTP